MNRLLIAVTATLCLWLGMNNAVGSTIQVDYNNALYQTIKVSLGSGIPEPLFPRRADTTSVSGTGELQFQFPDGSIIYEHNMTGYKAGSWNHVRVTFTTSAYTIEYLGGSQGSGSTTTSPTNSYNNGNGPGGLGIGGTGTGGGAGGQPGTGGAGSNNLYNIGTNPDPKQPSNTHQIKKVVRNLTGKPTPQAGQTNTEKTRGPTIAPGVYGNGAGIRYIGPQNQTAPKTNNPEGTPVQIIQQGNSGGFPWDTIGILAAFGIGIYPVKSWWSRKKEKEKTEENQ